MRWQSWARVIVALAGVGFAVALFVQMRQRPPVPVKPNDTGPIRTAGADSQSEQLVEVRQKDNHETSRLKSKLAVHFPDGRTRAEMVLEILHGEDGKSFEISSDVAEYVIPPGQDTGAGPAETTFTGHVRIKSSEGFALQCDRATYTDPEGMVRVPGRADFARGRFSGGGVGATYDRGQDVLMLDDQAVINTTADASGGGVLHASAKTIVLPRAEHVLRLDDNVAMTRDADTMRASHAVISLTDDDQIKRVELRGQSGVDQPPVAGGTATVLRAEDMDLDFVPEENRVQVADLRVGASVTHPGPAKGAPAKNVPPQMKAEVIHVEFQPDGRAVRHAVMTDRAVLTLSGADGPREVVANVIAALLSGDGQRATGLDAKDGVLVNLPEGATTPQRQIRAGTLTAKGTDAAGLTSAVFNAESAKVTVSLNERRTADAAKGRKAFNRYLYAQQMTLVLKGELDAIESATFTGGFLFKNIDTLTAKPIAEAQADKATFVEDGGQLVLEPEKGSPRKPWVNTDRLHVDAARIEMTAETNDLTAKGGGDDVRCNLKPDPSKKKVPGIFDNKVVVVASAAELVYTDQANEATFKGAAKLWQGSNFVSGDTVTIKNDSGNLDATGKIKSQVVLDSAPGGAKPATPPAAVRGCQPSATCVNADEMKYDDAKREASYTGGASLAGLNGQAISAASIVLKLKAEGRTLAGATAKGAVIANFAGDRQAQGDDLVYDASNDTYVVHGVPLVIIYRTADTAGEKCSKSIGYQLVFRPVNESLKRTDEYFDATERNGRSMVDVPVPSCAAVLKVIK